ncbi:MAG: xanthine phosphoribosyltransferase [Oscillospiraceae bacterium]|nr:xanthine phosphoribosyltransferase [Oscillospiraceae bacterium]
MNFLEERILRDGVVKPGNVLKVDAFLNHQIDVALLDEIGREFKRRFSGAQITKVLTIESSGIAIACAVAREFGVPVVFAKKAKTVNLDGEMYVAEVESFTHKKTNQVIVAKKFLNENDCVLIVDDFLANGCALQGLISLVDAAGAEVVGCGIVIEKGFQEGGYRIRNLGFRLESLAIIEEMDAENGTIKFREQE